MKTLLVALLLLVVTSCASTFSCEDVVRKHYPNSRISRVDKTTFVVVTDSCVTRIIKLDDAYTPPKILTDYTL